MINSLLKAFENNRMWWCYVKFRERLDREFDSLPGTYYLFIDEELDGPPELVFSYWSAYEEKLVLRFSTHAMVKNPGQVLDQIRMKVMFL